MENKNKDRTDEIIIHLMMLSIASFLANLTIRIIKFISQLCQ
jgi:hypothetical protein